MHNFKVYLSSLRSQRLVKRLCKRFFFCSLLWKQVKCIASAGKELPCLTPDYDVCFLEVKVKFLTVAIPVKIRSEMLKQAAELYWTPAVPKTRHEYCRAVSACVSFLRGKTEHTPPNIDLGAWSFLLISDLTVSLASFHQIKLMWQIFCVSVSFGSGFSLFSSHTDQWAGLSRQFPLKSFCQGTMSFWQNKTFQDNSFSYGIYRMFTKICSIKFLFRWIFSNSLMRSWQFVRKMKIKNVLAWFILHFHWKNRSSQTLATNWLSDQGPTE